MVQVQLDGIPQTLLLPLLTRATFSKQCNPIFFDKQALDVMQKLDYNFTSISQSFGATNLWWIARAYQFDSAVKDFLIEYPNAVIIDLGAGLETAFYRVDNGQLIWVDIDLPEVISLKHKLLPTSSRVHYFAGSIFDYSWINKVKQLGEHFMFISGGVFMYFTTAQIKELLNKLNSNFPESKIIFDFISKKGIKYANQKLALAQMNNAKITWGVDNVNEVLSMLPIGVEATKKKYFTGMKTRLDIPISSKLKLFFCDTFNKGGLALLTFNK
jgi:O-methyltransferase involved in polyketide biosynthesis